jgi:hypothetical protein
MNTLKVSSWSLKMVLFLVLILCTDEFVCKFSLFTVKFINEDVLFPSHSVTRCLIPHAGYEP